MALFCIITSTLFLTILVYILDNSQSWTTGSRKCSKRSRWELKALSQQVTQDDNIQIFPRSSSPPHLVVITERHCCDSDAVLQRALQLLHAAVTPDQVDLVSVRINVLSADKNHRRRLVELANRLLHWSDRHHFQVVVSSDWIDVAVETGVHGLHVNESDRHKIPALRKLLEGRPLIGTTAHTLESAVSAFEVHRPDYFFVGSCYFSQSYPEKTTLEGPELPGQVCRALQEIAGARRPKVLAIGGINASNCHEPVTKYGAEGVAILRSVFEGENPAESLHFIRKNMAKL